MEHGTLNKLYMHKWTTKTDSDSLQFAKIILDSFDRIKEEEKSAKMCFSLYFSCNNRSVAKVAGENNLFESEAGTSKNT